MSQDSDSFWKFVLGLASGLVLSYLYVQFGFKMPGVLGLGPRITAETISATAEAKLYDPDQPLVVRRRALAVIVGQKPELFLEIDQSQGHRFYAEMLRRKAVRKAILLSSQASGYDKVLSKRALRENLQRKHGVKDDETLKHRMLISDLREDEFLHAFLSRRIPDATEQKLVDAVLNVHHSDFKLLHGVGVPLNAVRPDKLKIR